MKVMVVEDSRAIRERVVAVLAGIVGKHAVLEAEAVKEAVEQIFEHKPDVVVLDLLLPDGHGLDVLTTIMALQQSTRVLVMSNDPNEQYRKRALQLGASHFFDKVRDFDKVFDTIADMVGESTAAAETLAD